MKKIKLLIIGKKSFLVRNLYFDLKKKIIIKLLNYEKFLKIKKKKLKKIDYICNCAISPKYVKYKYKKKNDIDLQIVKKIRNLSVNFIFLSSRKIYLNKENIKEDDQFQPRCNYSKNKLTTEKKILKLVEDKLIILRISNILGLKRNSPRKIHESFIDNYIKFLCSKKKIYYINEYKDFITIKQFTKIFFEILKNNLKGTYNISLNKKIYINEILKWLNYKNINKNIFFMRKKILLKDSFTLDNSKLINLIKFKINKLEVKNLCKKMGKVIYYKYN